MDLWELIEDDDDEKEFVVSVRNKLICDVNDDVAHFDGHSLPMMMVVNSNWTNDQYHYRMKTRMQPQPMK